MISGWLTQVQLVLHVHTSGHYSRQSTQVAAQQRGPLACAGPRTGWCVMQ